MVVNLLFGTWYTNRGVGCDYYLLVDTRKDSCVSGGQGVRMTKELDAMSRVLDNSLDKLPPSIYNKKTLFRSVQLTDYQIKDLFKVGKEYVEKGFMSTTHSQEALVQWLTINPSHNVLCKVIGKNGKLIEQASMLPHEAEVLFKSNSKFIVESMKPIPNPTNPMKNITEITLIEK